LIPFFPHAPMDLNSLWQGHHRSPWQFDGNSDSSLINADDALAETVALVRIKR